MDKDGTKSGFNLEMTRAISESVQIPVIASGGVGTLDHLVDGVIKGGSSCPSPSTPASCDAAATSTVCYYWAC